MEYYLKDRHAKLLELLPKHNYKVAPAAREAGFSPLTADKKAKSILQTALRKQNEIIEMQKKELGTNRELGTKEITSALKEPMWKKVGFGSESELMENVKWLAEQERDLATRLKVIKALTKEIGVDLSEDESQKVTVPVLNVTMEAPNTAQQSHITHTIHDMVHNVDCATLESEDTPGGTVAPETNDA